jgi:flavin-dependent dehydrogenase
MHVRTGHYLGIAPLSDELVNVCVVTGRRPEGRTPLDVVTRAIARSPEIAARFERASFVSPVSVLGPLAVDVYAAGVDGMLLAGDAAGFVDPMTGDGLHLALRGAVLATHEIKRVLESGDLSGAPERLAAARRIELSSKLRFNRALRRLVASPTAVGLAEWGARVAPGVFRTIVNRAGDAA